MAGHSITPASEWLSGQESSSLQPLSALKILSNKETCIDPRMSLNCQEELPPPTTSRMSWSPSLSLSEMSLEDTYHSTLDPDYDHYNFSHIYWDNFENDLWQPPA